ncbi:MAG: hypothetical protein K2K84_09565 [Muribaculaceae bacterium]|nr:hypothetical protein [Muribaculaceae bacterium]
MKNINKFFLVALAAGSLMTSCKTDDTLDDKMILGQAVPTCYWEVGSTVCKAGDSFTFQGKYNVEPGKNVNFSQVWYNVMRANAASVTVKLAGASLSYSKSISDNSEVRAYAPIATFLHKEAEWDGHEFVLTGSIKVSKTLAPVSWVDAAAWDQERFDTYYPAGFAQEFCDEVIEYLTKDSTYYNGLRTVYINYPFSNDQFKAVNDKYGLQFPDNIDMTGDDAGASDKSDLWFSTTEASDDAIIGYYYTTVEGENTIVHEVAKDAEQTPGINYYPVYKSSPWVFCRYNDDLGAIISTVRPQYMPAFIELLKTIKFEEWIYDSANQVYKVDFSRKYTLQSQFRVYDTDGEEGIAADVREISIN